MWPWCDNKAAAEFLNRRPVQTTPYSFMTSVAAHAKLLFARSPFRVGGCPAQHDTQFTSIIATFNKEEDEPAKRAFSGQEAQIWVVLGSWVDGPTIFVSHQGATVVNLKAELKATFVWRFPEKKGSPSH